MPIPTCFVTRQVLPRERGLGTHDLSKNSSVIKSFNIRFGERIIVNSIGLSNVVGTVPVHTSPASSERASMVRGALTVGMSDTGAGAIQASVTTGDTYLEERGIAHVDILKIDVEGAEMSVLHGFENTLARGAIDLVQFEYGAINLVTLDLLSGFTHSSGSVAMRWAKCIRRG